MNESKTNAAVKGLLERLKTVLQETVSFRKNAEQLNGLIKPGRMEVLFTDAITALESLARERADFHMAYRTKCDIETKAALVELTARVRPAGPEGKET